MIDAWNRRDTFPKGNAGEKGEVGGLDCSNVVPASWIVETGRKDRGWEWRTAASGSRTEGIKAVPKPNSRYSSRYWILILTVFPVLEG